jgi:hypothetical protein
LGEYRPGQLAAFVQLLSRSGVNKFAGSFVANAGYAKDVAFKTQPLGGGMAPKGSEVTTFISTGPPAGVFGINQCLNIIRVPVLPGALNLHVATPTPTG